MALAAGAATGTELPFAEMIVDRLRGLPASAWGGLDCTVVVRLVDGRSTPGPAIS